MADASTNIKFQDVKQYFNSLKSSVLCKYLNDEEINMLLTHNKIVAFNPGDFIIQQGKKIDELYIIVDGTVMMTARIMGQGAVNIETLKAGGFFGEISFIEKGPCARSGVAKTKVDCLVIKKTHFNYLAEYLPEVKYKMLTALTEYVCNRLKRVHDKVLSFISDSDMVTVSFFGKIIQSLTQPHKIAFAEHSAYKTKLLKDPLFSFCSQEETAELFNHSILFDAPKNCMLMQGRENKATCYIVIQGAVQTSIMKNNKIAKLSIIGSGKFIANIACVNSDPSYTITFTTCERTILLKIPEAELLYFRQYNKEFWYKLFDLICESLVILGKSLDKLDIRLHIETYNR